MKLLIVNLHFDIGGVETLLLRIMPSLSQAGYNVTLLILTNKYNFEMLEEVSKHCRVVFLKKLFPYSTKKIISVLGKDFDVAFYTISHSVMIGSWLMTKICCQPYVYIGVYQTELFCSEYSWWQFNRRIVTKAIMSLDSRSFIFGNTAGRDYHSLKLNKNLENSHILRLFVDVDKYTFKDRSLLERTTIVSIGRISPYKTYNFTFLRAFKELIDEGYRVKWKIYGSGEDSEKLKNLIAKEKLVQYVSLHGNVDYSLFEKCLEDAFLFIGSGTSLIESAACGVPSITTIEKDDLGLSYGFICDIIDDNIVENIDGRPRIEIKSLVKYAYHLGVEDYLSLQLKCRIKAEQYRGEEVVAQYKKIFTTHGPVQNIYVPTYKILFYLISGFISKLVSFVVQKISL